MGLRIRYQDWQRQLWKFITHPVTEILALVALVLAALAMLITVEPKVLRNPDAPVIFSPK